MKSLSKIILGLALFGFSCSSVRVPKSPVKAKRVVENNVRQINAITEFHNLKSPFIKLDTIIFELPERKNSFFVPLSIDKNLGIALNDYLDFIDPSKKVEVVEKIKEVIKSTEVNHVYQDSLINISIRGNADSLVIDYTIFAETLSKPVEFESVTIDTNVKWFEDRFIQIILFAFIVLLLVLIIRREGGIKPPSLKV